jgi:hypothetical protein
MLGGRKPTVHPNLAVTPPILRSVDTNKDDAEVEARNPHAPHAVYTLRPTSMAVSMMAVEPSSRRPKR